MASDGRLVVALAHGNRRALAEVFRRHGGTVHNLARLVLRSSALADEVTQDVFLDLWTQPEEFDSERGALRAFLVTEAHGRAVDVMRYKTVYRSHEELIAREPVAATYRFDQYSWALAVVDQVQAATTVLPSKGGRAIRMRNIDHQVESEIVGVPETQGVTSTARSASTCSTCGQLLPRPDRQ
jgi:RNA polymerase sigma factor (sigma-70 family)